MPYGISDILQNCLVNIFTAVLSITGVQHLVEFGNLHIKIFDALKKEFRVGIKEIYELALTFIS